MKDEVESHSSSLRGARGVSRKATKQSIETRHGAWRGAQGTYAEFRELIRRKKIRHESVAAGDVIKGFKNAEFYVFNPQKNFSHGDLNEDSVVLKLVTAEGESVLFAADAGSDAMEDMLAYGGLLASDVLKVPHHGGNIGGGPAVDAFLEKVRCGVAVISGGPERPRSGALVKKLNEMRTVILDTARSGAVIVREGGKGFIPSVEIASSPLVKLKSSSQ